MGGEGEYRHLSCPSPAHQFIVQGKPQARFHHAPGGVIAGSGQGIAGTDVMTAKEILYVRIFMGKNIDERLAVQVFGSKGLFFSQGMGGRNPCHEPVFSERQPLDRGLFPAAEKGTAFGTGKEWKEASGLRC